jgi:hypothetical protein
MPPLGILFGWLLLGEHVEPVDIIGILPVALGIYLVTRPAQRSSTLRLHIIKSGRGLTVIDDRIECPSGKVS